MLKKSFSSKRTQIGWLAAVLFSSLMASAGTTTYTRVEEMTGWQTCGACGNSGGGGAVAPYSMSRGIGSPNMDGSSSEFQIGGSHPYSNAYWYLRHAAPSTGIKYLAYDFYIYVPAAAASAPEAIEFECQQRVNGWTYNFAWQADYAANQWRVFNYGSRRWESSGLPLQKFSPDRWHHIVAEYHTSTSSHSVYHDAITIDGVRHVLNLKHGAHYTGNMSNEFTNAFQLDLNGGPTAYKVYVDQMKINMTY